MNGIDNALTQFAAPKFTTVRENDDGSVSLLSARGVEVGMASVSVVQKYENHLRCKALNAGISKWWPAYVQSRSRRFGMSYVPARHVRGWTPE